MQYETVIGLEVHVQLHTRSKMFCGCPADYQAAEPNTRTCPVCLGLPGALPVINRRAVEYTVLTGLALNCRIPEFTKFDRKNYPYPDLMKGYQISQYDLPLALDGFLEIDGDTQLGLGRRRIGVERVHLEEDVAKSYDDRGEGYSLVDVNRSGVPLMEVVSKPDMRSAEEARQYLTLLHSIVQYLGVSTGNMQDGNFRCDANVSIRPVGSQILGTRTEVKNMNSFRAVYQALEYEVVRQREVIEDGGAVVQETRGWIEEREVTVSQRSKEYAHDYRYFPEPDLPPLRIGPERVAELAAELPEFAPQRSARFQADLALSGYDADLLAGSRSMANYFETTLTRAATAKEVANWMLGDLARLLNQDHREIDASPVTPQRLADLLALVADGTLSTSLAKTVLEEMYATGGEPADIVREQGLGQISDTGAIEAAVAEAIAANPKAVADYISGKDTAARFLMGQVMRLTKGQAQPELALRLVQEGLELQKTRGSLEP
ncbi:Aspartyl/glutamyl-tRNA(Asn/Gln) amidotransferase subunit B [Geodia barretti]|uniref:Glutamyl-tRNA(Gln) amidotransferase subunit B, mitochondrial n=2 Tax=Geodia barretti TaxID=519541 RepID=A0AA35STH0_GEOBA|nr:Aspartyl/glutamyl-tRNA(Asn/Gln) amidotransferase subunit B [Geodia barretti]